MRVGWEGGLGWDGGGRKGQQQGRGAFGAWANLSTIAAAITILPATDVNTSQPPPGCPGQAPVHGTSRLALPT